MRIKSHEKEKLKDDENIKKNLNSKNHLKKQLK
jgi:hypothetical protein